jgi:hypothetical protein
MLMAKLKMAVGAVMVVVALGTSGLVYRASGQSAPAVTERKPDSKPRSELEALRRENELLKLNLEVVLEKVRAQEAELRTLRGQVKAPLNALGVAVVDFDRDGSVDLFVVNETRRDPLQEAEAALKALREARNGEAQRKAADSLEKALQKLREQQKKQAGPANDGRSASAVGQPGRGGAPVRDADRAGGPPLRGSPRDRLRSGLLSGRAAHGFGRCGLFGSGRCRSEHVSRNSLTPFTFWSEHLRGPLLARGLLISISEKFRFDYFLASPLRTL